MNISIASDANRPAGTLRCARGRTWPRINSMRRIGAIFIAVCMVLDRRLDRRGALSRLQDRRQHLGDCGAGSADRHGALQHSQQSSARSRRSRRPDRRSVAWHRRPCAPGRRDLAPPQCGRAQDRVAGQSCARRLRSARHRNRRAWRAGEADRRNRRRPCRCACRSTARWPGVWLPARRRPSPLARPKALAALGENDPLVERFRGLSRESLADLLSKAATDEPQSTCTCSPS